MPTTLAVGCTFSDRIEALLDGRVGVAGYGMDVRIVEPQRLFRQVLREGAHDVAELSMASHIAAVANGRRDHVGVPVFLSRSFRHGNVYIRTDRGIDRPEDLAGRTIGMIDFQQTAGLWVRGLLADDYGVARESIRWVTAGLHAPVLEDRAPMTLPPTLRVERSSGTLDAMLADGTIDAVISPTAPACFVNGSAPVARLWPDPRAAERLYWRRRAIFPIMHILVVRRALVEQDPTLPAALLDVFDQARTLAAADLATRDFPKLTLPWLSDHVATVHADLGCDPWTYGVDANRATIATMLRYAETDRLIPSGLTPEALFR